MQTRCPSRSATHFGGETVNCGGCSCSAEASPAGPLAAHSSHSREAIATNHLLNSAVPRVEKLWESDPQGRAILLIVRESRGVSLAGNLIR